MFVAGPGLVPEVLSKIFTSFNFTKTSGRSLVMLALWLAIYSAPSSPDEPEAVQVLSTQT